MNVPVAAYIGLGGNLGDVAVTLRQALIALDALPDTRLRQASGLYATPAWGVREQPDFVNAVAELETGLSPRGLLQSLLRIERDFGRDRRHEQRWGPRRLDLDLLLYGDTCIEEAGLSVPHPQMLRRAFVLVPLLEIAPDVQVPGHGPARNAVSALESDEMAHIRALDVDNSPS
ncbi:2-amino-4-hydroxy-6-hydroxymethyldihydropteridine diphosphokinase [Pseudoxanthomonas kalamensis DSM 18571]|uniref:2-amino-4-hydroxy-6- hydroxymethyldihydropteridine diphosphokinase n=1 Tax=Pseudoxanthomonas kalamensis TaxID=289483 RepID=UPI001391D8C4|nr:2-amino-4-hydroxy-6-hydroxymethyldihydropteridine diphosphokinase [Pseudoxanthomonas kalamensis]KAF1709986.1 2-amino-4-hydroxy-6-hydroxymethyldihydropteridine diphosphokinase [Pseudoxanthomonas kalamensis DSM 18571]